MRKMKNGVDIKVKLNGKGVWLSGNTNIEIIRKILWLGEKSIYGIFAISFIIFFVV